MVDAVAELERGREAYAREAWSDAFESLLQADRESPLVADDLGLLATSAYMLGRESEYLGFLERAHRAHLDAGESLPALRCAFWIGVTLANHGEVGRASGWLGRAQRLLDREGSDRVERGYLLLPVVFEQEASGDLKEAAATAGEAAAIGERFDDQDLFALAAHEQGHILIKAGRLSEGLGLLDEAMVAVTAGELSPIVSGIVYCGVILACQDAYEVGRAREWTAALSGWCERQPDLVAFTGRCLVHRAEIMQLHGAWSNALEEARRAAERCLSASSSSEWPARAVRHRTPCARGGGSRRRAGNWALRRWRASSGAAGAISGPASASRWGYRRRRWPASSASIGPSACCAPAARRAGRRSLRNAVLRPAALQHRDFRELAGTSPGESVASLLPGEAGLSADRSDATTAPSPWARSRPCRRRSRRVSRIASPARSTRPAWPAV